jgi:hypothetical protein
MTSVIMQFSLPYCRWQSDALCSATAALLQTLLVRGNWLQQMMLFCYSMVLLFCTRAPIPWRYDVGFSQRVLMIFAHPGILWLTVTAASFCQ